MTDQTDITKEMLENFVLKEKLSNVKISKLLNISRIKVASLLTKYDIHRTIITQTKCAVCDKFSVGEYCNTGYCDKHLYQIKNHGKILERTRFDKNEIFICDEYAEIVMYDKTNKEKCRAKIDIEDIELVKNYKWAFTDYVCASDRTRLHRLVMGVSNISEKIVDHINRDVLDNRKSNLRIATNQENVINRSTQVNNSSGQTGVSWHKTSSMWRAFIQFNKKFIHLGLFNNKEDAIAARKRAEEKCFGEFTPIK